MVLLAATGGHAPLVVPVGRDDISRIDEKPRPRVYDREIYVVVVASLSRTRDSRLRKPRDHAARFYVLLFILSIDIYLQSSGFQTGGREHSLWVCRSGILTFFFFHPWPIEF